jgi:DNA polymerase-3 subunit gamma/tau
MLDFTAKYRPQKVEELDLVSIREGLAKVLKSGKIPHAFLFAGPRGTGKTSAARIIAKAINCEKKLKNEKTKKQKGSSVSRSLSAAKGGYEPCNQCDQCLSVTGGTNIDVLEIDAASNRGIDDIRELREKIKLAPAKAQYKAYIVDEVHMLTTEAFNALLKTLEEPPPHAVFILCTTAPEKLPETIISRCLRFNFKRPTIKEIVAKLEKIAKEEKLKVEKQALLEIARGVDGSFRDANKILEQASFESKEIDLETVKEILGQAVGFDPKKLIGFLVNREAKEAIGEINRLTESGANLRFYLEQLLEELRGLLLRQYGIEVDGQELAEFNLEKKEIERLIRLFSQAAIQLREAVIPQLPLELAVVEWGEGGGAEVRQSSARLQTRPAGSTPSPSGLPRTDEDLTGSLPSPRPRKRGSKKFSLEEIHGRWQEVLLWVRPKNHSVEALLRATRPKAIDGQILTVEVFYKFHKDKLETEKCRQLVEEAACEVYQGSIKIKFLLGEKPRTADLPARPAGGPAGKAGVTDKKKEFTETSVKPAPKPVSSAGPGNGETTDRDIIEVAKEIFSGSIE